MFTGKRCGGSVPGRVGFRLLWSGGGGGGVQLFKCLYNGSSSPLSSKRDLGKKSTKKVAKKNIIFGTEGTLHAPSASSR